MKQEAIYPGDMVRTDWALGGSPDKKSREGFVKKVSPNGTMLIVSWNVREGCEAPPSAILASKVMRLAR